MPSVLTPVSYTHLDVYKRQVLHYYKEVNQGISEEIQSTYTGREVFFAVSYTHLDVYKRQDMDDT